MAAEPLIMLKALAAMEISKGLLGHFLCWHLKFLICCHVGCIHFFLWCKLLFTIFICTYSGVFAMTCQIPDYNKCVGGVRMLCESHKNIFTFLICRYCPCFSGGGYCSDKCGCQPCFNKEAFAETVHTTRKVLLSRQKRMSMKINRRPEANTEPMVVILTRLSDVTLFKFSIRLN